jgi:hypothetical protein
MVKSARRVGITAFAAVLAVLAAVLLAGCGSAEGGPAGIPSGEVTDLKKQEAGDTWATLSWIDPENGDFDRLEITITGDGDPPSIFVPKSLLGDRTNGATITGLTPDTEYTFTVRAVNNFGGITKPVQLVMVPSSGPSYPDKVGNLTAVPDPGTGTVSLSWDNPTTFHHIEITFDPKIPGVLQPITPLDPTATSETITGLDNEYPYTFTVWTVKNPPAYKSPVQVKTDLGDILSNTKLAIDTYIAAHPGAGTPDDPVPLTLSPQPLTGDNWRAILTAIAEKKKYVKLDLSAWTRGSQTSGSGLYFDGTFDPNPGNQSGKDFIVSFTLPNATEKLRGGSFSWVALKTVVLPGALAEIEVNPFRACGKLEAIQVDPSNTAYKDEGGVLLNFMGTTVIAYPRAKATPPTSLSVTTVGDYAFYGASLTSLLDLPAVKTIGERAFENCTLTSLSLPVAETIGGHAFQDSNLTSLNLLAVKTIGDYAFWDCASLTSLSLSASLKTIGNSAFSGCTGLTSLSLPAVETIGNFAFSGCTGLDSLSLPASPPSLGTNVFTSTYDDTVPTATLSIIVPDAAAVSAYTTSVPPGWDVAANMAANNTNTATVYGVYHKAINITP